MRDPGTLSQKPIVLPDWRLDEEIVIGADPRRLLIDG